MEKVQDLKFLVIGDIMLDKYVIGNVERISPEAPVPVVDVKKEYCTLGGCGNVAKNLAKLGVRTVCIAASGTGAGKDKLLSLMGEQSIQANLVASKFRSTTIKERIISEDRNTQLLRIDRETREAVDSSRVITEINHVIRTQQFIPDVILISDYSKGMITSALMYYVEDVSRKHSIKLIVDPKPINEINYHMAYAITPNRKEFEEMRDIVSSPFIKNIVVTCGSDGVRIVKSEGHGALTIGAETVDVYNVTGAGDSFVAIFSVCSALGIDVVQSTRIANKCASYVVTKPGTVSVPVYIFENAVKSVFPKGVFSD